MLEFTRRQSLKDSLDVGISKEIKEWLKVYGVQGKDYSIVEDENNPEFNTYIYYSDKRGLPEVKIIEGFAKESYAIEYHSSLSEKELHYINSLSDIIQKEGFEKIENSLPDIYLSFETPPQLKKIEEKAKKGDDKTVIKIDELLGEYYPKTKTIKLYQEGLVWCSEKFNIDYYRLKEVVLIHEIGHWITHCAIHENSCEWELDLYKITEPEVHEGWAQLFVWWIAEAESNEELKSAFEELNKHQSEPYCIFEQFVRKTKTEMLEALIKLREIENGASLEKVNKILKI